MIRGEGEPAEEPVQSEGSRLEEIEAERRAEAERQVQAARRAEAEKARAEAERAAAREEPAKPTPAVPVAAAGPAVGSLAGLAGVVLAVLGLVGMLPEFMAAIAAICVGVALISEGGAIQAQFARVIGRGGGGMSTGTLGGGAGIVLGVLALLGLAAPTLLAVSVIVFGAAMLVSSAAAARLHEASAAAGFESHGGAHTLVGLSAVVLGILALLAVGGAGAPLTLTLIGLLVLAGGLTLGGGVSTTPTHARPAR